MAPELGWEGQELERDDEEEEGEGGGRELEEDVEEEDMGGGRCGWELGPYR